MVFQNNIDKRTLESMRDTQRQKENDIGREKKTVRQKHR